MLDPLFPVRIECLRSADAPTVVTGGEYLAAWLSAGRMVFKHPAGRGLLDAGQALLAGEELAATLTLQRGAVLRLVRFGRPLYDRLAVQFYEPDFLEELFPKKPPSGALKPVILSPGPRAAEVEAVFEELEREFRERPGRYRLMIQCRLVELFVLLGRARGKVMEGGTEPAPAGSVAALIAHIQEHYTDEFSLEDLAARLNLSPAYFSRLFHEKAGKPLFEFINSIRVQKACQLLKRTNLPIIEIAYSVGYNNLSFFNRYFRKLMRMSPREYKNL